VRGLAFQQQDVGVAACSATAIWSALHRARDLEPGSIVTPAEITMRAAHSPTPWGRAFPSDGLTVEQMCHAIQSFGSSPDVLRVESYETAQRFLYSSLRSGMPPILVVRGVDGERREFGHALLALGMRLRPVPRAGGDRHEAQQLRSIILHDDRIGPYCEAEVVDRREVPRSIRREEAFAEASTFLQLKWGRGEQPELLAVTHVLIALHHKIRLSFRELEALSQDALRLLEPIVQFLTGRLVQSIDLCVSRPQQYFDRLCCNPPLASAEAISCLTRTLALPRYLGIIRLRYSNREHVDILVDTTSTARNPVVLAVVFPNGSSDELDSLRNRVRNDLGCRVLPDRQTDA
jgi:hypothetical protein